jgi:acetolactate synthase I/II/III large subunit
VVLAGHGAGRDNSQDTLIRFSERFHIPVATTFMRKGFFPDKHPNALGTVGFMCRDYIDFGFGPADVLVCNGYDLQSWIITG